MTDETEQYLRDRVRYLEERAHADGRRIVMLEAALQRLEAIVLRGEEGAP